MNLRFVERPNGERTVRILQQAWVHMVSGEVWWLDVPLGGE